MMSPFNSVTATRTAEPRCGSACEMCSIFCCAARSPAIRGLALKPLADPSASTLDLATAGDRALVWPEVRYEHGFYLNSVTIPLRIDDGAVAVVEASGPG